MVKNIFSFILLVSFSLPTALPGIFGHLQLLTMERQQAALVDLGDSEQSENTESLPTLNDIEEKVVHITTILRLPILVELKRIVLNRSVDRLRSACVNTLVGPPPEIVF